ncbi:hypothetical protein [Dactylosporangium sp. CA-233914]|uniref:hypothetical protein n=1 Tax=Dactylosporangium sp. CA-233914 TaxID=3239934 RepID=UPI003D8C56B9
MTSRRSAGRPTSGRTRRRYAAREPEIAERDHAVDDKPDAAADATTAAQMSYFKV